MFCGLQPAPILHSQLPPQRPSDPAQLLPWSPPPQALLSRGDRRLSRLLPIVRQYGDSLGSFRRAFNELEGQLPPMEHYVHRNYEPEMSALPWQHIQGPLPAATLQKHLQDARQLM